MLYVTRSSFRPFPASRSWFRGRLVAAASGAGKDKGNRSVPFSIMLFLVLCYYSGTGCIYKVSSNFRLHSETGLERCGVAIRGSDQTRVTRLISSPGSGGWRANL